MEEHEVDNRIKFSSLDKLKKDGDRCTVFFQEKATLVVVDNFLSTSYNTREEDTEQITATAICFGDEQNKTGQIYVGNKFIQATTENKTAVLLHELGHVHETIKQNITLEEIQERELKADLIAIRYGYGEELLDILNCISSLSIVQAISLRIRKNAIKEALSFKTKE